MSDVRLYESLGQGQIDCVNGQLLLSEDGLESAVFISMFGGNEDDTGLQADDSRQWWGNLSEGDPARRYRSETQALLRALPLTPGNLRRVEDAATRDLEWMTDSIADAVVAQASLTGVNRLSLAVSIEINSQIFRFVFETPR